MFNLEPDGGNLVEEKASGPCFFSVLQTAPSKAKTLRSAAAYGRIPGCAITVVMHNAKLDRERFRLPKEVAGTHGGTMEPMALQTSLRTWSVADVLEYTLGGIGGLPQRTKAVFHTSVSHGATPNLCACVLHQRFQCPPCSGHGHFRRPRIRGPPRRGVAPDSCHHEGAPHGCRSASCGFAGMWWCFRLTWLGMPRSGMFGVTRPNGIC